MHFHNLKSSEKALVKKKNNNKSFIDILVLQYLIQISHVKMSKT